MESDGKLFYRIDKKTGRTVTNLLEWERSWKNVKILKYPTRFANELRLGVRENPTIEQILTNNVMLPEVRRYSERVLDSDGGAEYPTSNDRRSSHPGHDQ